MLKSSEVDSVDAFYSVVVFFLASKCSFLRVCLTNLA